jgi:hypothetical protein
VICSFSEADEPQPAPLGEGHGLDEPGFDGRDMLKLSPVENDGFREPRDLPPLAREAVVGSVDILV